MALSRGASELSSVTEEAGSDSSQALLCGGTELRASCLSPPSVPGVAWETGGVPGSEDLAECPRV